MGSGGKHPLGADYPITAEAIAQSSEADGGDGTLRQMDPGSEPVWHSLR